MKLKRTPMLCISYAILTNCLIRTSSGESLTTNDWTLVEEETLKPFQLPPPPEETIFTAKAFAVRLENDPWTNKKFFQQYQRHTFGRPPKRIGSQRRVFKKQHLPRKSSC